MKWINVLGCLLFLLGAPHDICARDITNPRISENGQQLIVTDFPGHRFLVFSRDGKDCAEISGTLTAGRMAVWSPDGKRIGFKIVIKRSDGRRVQAPAVWDSRTGTIRLLTEYSSLAGNPAFSRNNWIAFSCGKQVRVLDEQFKTVYSFNLPGYTNFKALSPDGKQVIYSNPDDRLILYNANTGTHTMITPEKPACFGPVWSPNGRFILFSSLSGILYLKDVDSTESIRLGPGDMPCWLPDSTSFIASERVFKGDRLKGINLVRYEVEGNKTILYSSPDIWPESPSLCRAGSEVVFRDSKTGEVMQCRITGDTLSDLNPVHVPMPVERSVVPDVNIPPDILSLGDRDITCIRGVPYHHQVYCTPAGFNGHWACNGTAATMALAYYGILPTWDFTATTPFPHTSSYGNYVSEIYTYNGYTFDTGSLDPNDNMAFGAYGYIVQNNWEDTKEHMKEYLSMHAVSSPYVDWSPTWSELQAEVTNRNPFVLLSSITSSGHYKTVVGYHQGQHTIYFNDPYGNKNQGYMNFNGAGVSYDWPNYNNGYENLNTVWCYLYARSTPPAEEQGTVSDPIVITVFPFTDDNTTRSSGGTDLFDTYSCAPSVNESGREKTYRFTVSEPGTLTASVVCDGDVDIDIHLLNTPDAGSCLARAHLSFTEPIDAGTYWLTCDTWVDDTTLIEYMGDYTLTCAFEPDVAPTVTPAVTPTPTPVAQSVPATRGTGLGILLLALTAMLSFKRHHSK
jgi:Tol biopolymer transport system component